jgi:hypothetical protein
VNPQLNRSSAAAAEAPGRRSKRVLAIRGWSGSVVAAAMHFAAVVVVIRPGGVSEPKAARLRRQLDAATRDPSFVDP